MVQIITLLHRSLPSRKLDPSLGIDSHTSAVKGVVHISTSIVHQSKVSGWSLASPSSQAQSPGTPHHHLSVILVTRRVLSTSLVTDLVTYR